jgi:hypothetical protein
MFPMRRGSVSLQTPGKGSHRAAQNQERNLRQAGEHRHCDQNAGGKKKRLRLGEELVVNFVAKRGFAPAARHDQAPEMEIVSTV